jgi:hypothetical protein
MGNAADRPASADGGPSDPVAAFVEACARGTVRSDADGWRRAAHGDKAEQGASLAASTRALRAFSASCHTQAPAAVHELSGLLQLMDERGFDARMVPLVAEFLGMTDASALTLSSRAQRAQSVRSAIPGGPNPFDGRARARWSRVIPRRTRG